MSHVLPAPIFIADAKGLDFLNSIATPVDTPVEWLGSGADFLRWIKEADLAPAEVLSSFKGARSLDAVASDARALREWFRRFVQKHKGKPLNPSAQSHLAPLNLILGKDECHGEVVVREGAWVVEESRRWKAPASLLLPIAREIAKVICQEDFSLVRSCEGHSCTLVFADHTKSHRRRWCSMAACGNRAKQIAYRERKL